MRVAFLLFAIILLSTMSYSMATDTASKEWRIASYHIPLLVDDRENGAFMELLREAARRADVRYVVVMAPAKRAMRYFEDGEVVAIVPALRATLAKDAVLTRPIFTKQIHAFVREGDSIPENIASLKGLRIGLTRGFSYPRSITVNEKIEVDYADTTEGSLKKLLEGRIDAVIADGYTALFAIEKMNLSGFHYDLSIILHEQPVYMAFQPTEEGKELAQKLSRSLDSMEADGTMRRILPDISGKSQ
ncbi:transporter substrate-binding domain-containing protein [uncultured Pseudodesulfovibrio sp.]|uniref:substrate-binding periplasmic protein n=1 Tax=uncultured Pseudodesulfovibrio sp. TaxID=2035858 RepID=UPI0029C6B2E6|nr:transporter substrate-binding domain-containing protein [uncultured Pseudodesulfovibrio sp.]